MNNTFRLGIAAAAVVVVAALIGYRLLIAPNVGGPGPTPSPSLSPTPLPTDSAAPSPSATQTAVAHFPGFPGAPRPVDAGTYDLGPNFPVLISFVVPSGWLSCTNNAGLLCKADGWGGVNIWIVTNVVTDPCDNTVLRDPPVGPTVDDLVSAILSLPWGAVTPPSEITVDGFRGREFEVTAPASSPCVGADDFATWSTTQSDSGMDVSPGERSRLRILDVHGTRVMIEGYYLPGTTSTQALAEINSIIDSVRIEP
jgi:hypothetical protein